MVFDARRDDVGTWFGHFAEYGEIIGLHSAAGEEHFHAAATKKIGDLLPCPFDCGARGAAMRVPRGRVPILIEQPKLHHLEDFR